MRRRTKLKALAGARRGVARLAHVARDGLISGRDPLEAEGQGDASAGIVPFGLMHGNRLDDPLHGGLGDNGISGAADIFQDRKSTRLNSSHLGISYAVFCLKK